MRTKSVGGMKLQTWWRGPMKIFSRVVKFSYKVRDPSRGPVEVHTDQLKPSA